MTFAGVSVSTQITADDVVVWLTIGPATSSAAVVCVGTSINTVKIRILISPPLSQRLWAPVATGPSLTFQMRSNTLILASPKASRKTLPPIEIQTSFKKESALLGQKHRPSSSKTGRSFGPSPIIVASDSR